MNMNFERLKEKNPDIPFYPVTDAAFQTYGRIITSYPLEEVLAVMEKKDIPESGNKYTASDPDLMDTEFASLMTSHFYAGIPSQVGYCNGTTDRLNALEYHKCSELDIAVTDLVLLLSDVRLIRSNQLSSDQVTAFYVPRGIAVELYATTLHFAPCRVSPEGFKSIIVLTAGTNEPLASLPEAVTLEDRLIWMKNKWLIAHPDSIPASKGAYAGIQGENLQIQI
ncbi:Uncharacterised protein [uncultured Clostridium sp.]|nr:Uncharacterised protein [uncultured Clostridium sp.]